MSRIGKAPIVIPDNVEISIDGQNVKAKGPKGELVLDVHEEVSITMADVANDEGKTEKQIVFEPRSDSKIAKQVWPTMRTLVSNNIVGVSEGYSKLLEIHGVGFRANLQGKTLVMTLGFSHEVRFDVPDSVEVKVDDQTKITVSGINKQIVGQVAANIRGFKPPEPYKGKGIRYSDEYVIRKEGKKK